MVAAGARVDAVVRVECNEHSRTGLDETTHADGSASGGGRPRVDFESFTYLQLT